MKVRAAVIVDEEGHFAVCGADFLDDKDAFHNATLELYGSRGGKTNVARYLLEADVPEPEAVGGTLFPVEGET